MSAGGVRQAEWPGRGGQLREVGVLRPGIGDDQGRLGVSAGAGYGCRGRFGGFVAEGGGLKPLCIDGAGGVEAAIRSLQYYSLKLRRKSERYATARRVIRYFTKNKEKMQYCDFKARGLPIGSGPVEAACKTVVGARLKRSGMRWSRPGGQNVLNLRIHQLSGRWSTFWNVYQQQDAA